MWYNLWIEISLRKDLCSVFQNIVEDMILFRKCSDRQIIDFYKEIKEALAGKDYQIVYLKADDVAANIDVIRKERSDDNGNEMWFPLMLRFLMILLMQKKRECQVLMPCLTT